MENNNKYENNMVGMAQYYGGNKSEELKIFKGKKVKDKSKEVLVAALQKRAKSQNKNSDSNSKEKNNDSTTDENPKKQDYGSPMENMLEYLMGCFEFISVNNKELYYYIPEYGYW